LSLPTTLNLVLVLDQGKPLTRLWYCVIIPFFGVEFYRSTTRLPGGTKCLVNSFQDRITKHVLFTFLMEVINISMLQSIAFVATKYLQFSLIFVGKAGSLHVGKLMKLVTLTKRQIKKRD